MIRLQNGIKVFSDPSFEGIWLGLSDFGFESDHQGIFGISHLLEHIIIQNNYRDFLFNGSTTRNGMIFWCKPKGNKTYTDAIYELLSWFFFPDCRMRVHIFQNIDNFFKELENEFYYRDTNFTIRDPIYACQGLPTKACGRYFDFCGKEHIIKREIRKKLLYINPCQINIFVKALDIQIVETLNKTFGAIPNRKYEPTYPMFRIPSQTDSRQNIIFSKTDGDLYKICIRITPDEHLINTAALFSLYSGNADLQFYSGKPWLTFYYMEEEDVLNFCYSLSERGLFFPIDWHFPEPVYCGNSPSESIVKLYIKSPTITWDFLSDPDITMIDFYSLAQDLQNNIRIYGNVIMIAPILHHIKLGVTEFEDLFQPGWLDYRYPADIILRLQERLNQPDRYTSYPNCIFRHSNMSSLENAKLVQDKINDLVQTQDCCDCYDIKKTTHYHTQYNPHELAVIRPLTEREIAAICKILIKINAEIYGDAILMNRYVQKSFGEDDQYMNLSTSFFFGLFELLFRANLYIDSSEILKQFNTTTTLYSTPISISDKKTILRLKKPPPTFLKSTWTIQTPFRFVSMACTFDVSPTKDKMLDILWQAKCAGIIYELKYFAYNNMITIHTHSTDPVNTETELREMMTKCYQSHGLVNIYSIISLKSLDNQIDLSALPIKETFV